jgi:hypothetical protein
MPIWAAVVGQPGCEGGECCYSAKPGCHQFGGAIMIGKLARAGILAIVITAPAAGVAAARTVYDGAWSLTFNTKRGACDPAYHFHVRIDNGIVSHANLVKFRGRVSRGGAVRASVSVPGKYAAGSGRLSRTSGHGRWAGHAGQARCSGSWTAQSTDPCLALP